MNQRINKFICALNYTLIKTNYKDIKIIDSKIITLIAWEYLGGEIVKSNENKNYINYINSKYFDFKNKEYYLDNNNFSYSKKYLMNQILINSEMKPYYNILKFKIKEFYKAQENIELAITQCQLCALDKVAGNNIYFGTNTKILLVGEAPAKNGWRITGKAWINEKGKIIPSGVILEKLLKNSNIGLFDISFVEIIKCFPSDRKKLKEYAVNCFSFFDQQIELMQPDIIIPLGEIPTRILLREKKFKRLSEVIGEEYKYKNTTIIPIYHPSPISPKSFTGNQPIFDNIINKYL